METRKYLRWDPFVRIFYIHLFSKLKGNLEQNKVQLQSATVASKISVIAWCKCDFGLISNILLGFRWFLYSFSSSCGLSYPKLTPYAFTFDAFDRLQQLREFLFWSCSLFFYFLLFIHFFYNYFLFFIIPEVWEKHLKKNGSFYWLSLKSVYIFTSTLLVNEFSEGHTACSSVDIWICFE